MFTAIIDNLFTHFENCEGNGYIHDLDLLSILQ